MMKQEYKIHFFPVLIIIVLCCLNIRKLDYIFIINDEFGYWAQAVSAVGFDWKDLIVETPFYSWGYSLCLIPIVAFLPTPELWYKVAIILNVLFLILSYFLCAGCGKRLFPKADRTLICMASLVTIIYPGNIVYAQATWTETLLVLLMWVETYLIISLDERFRFRNFVAAIAVLLYMYAVHPRSIGIIVAGILFLGVIIVKHKKNIGCFLMLGVLMMIGYKLVGTVNNYQLATLWDNSETSALNNVVLDQNTLGGYFDRLANQTLMLLSSLGGKYIYLVIATGLTLPVAIGQIAKETIKNIKNKNLFDGCMIGKWWGVTSIGLMWGVCSLQMNDWKIRKDCIVYGRYMENAIGPILFIGIMYVIVLAKQIRIELLISVVSLIIGMYPVYKCIMKADGWFNVICSPVVGAFFQIMEESKSAIALIIVMMTVLAIALFYSISQEVFKKRAVIVIIFFLACFSMLGYHAGKYGLNIRNTVDCRTVPLRDKVVKDMADSEIYFVKNPSVGLNPKYLQFLIPEKTIHVIGLHELESKLNNGNLLIILLEDDESRRIIEEKDNAIQVDTSWLFDVYKAE